MIHPMLVFPLQRRRNWDFFSSLEKFYFVWKKSFRQDSLKLTTREEFVDMNSAIYAYLEPIEKESIFYHSQSTDKLTENN